MNYDKALIVNNDGISINIVYFTRNKDTRYVRMEPMQETNVSDVLVTINRPIKVLHFSDGVEEEIQQDKANELQSVPNNNENVDPKTLTWGPWISYYAWKSSTKALSAVDTAGETLASFFGITTPKYQIEINEYERLQEEKKKIEEESAGWVPKSSGGNVPLVLNEPVKDNDITKQV